MQSPSKQGESSLYEVPSCTICLVQLVQDLASLACGHTYHLGCISQHFEYRATCPNCQKRASLKQARIIHLRFIKHNNLVNTQIESVLSSLEGPQRNQVEALMKELKASNNSRQKMKEQVASLESDVKSKTKVVDSLREQIYKHKVEWDKTYHQNRKLSQSCKQLKEELEEHMKLQAKWRKQCQKLRSQEREYEQMKRYKLVLQEKAPSITNYKAELQANSTPPQVMAKNFYEMLQMKHLEVLRAKDNLRQLSERTREKETEVSKQRATIQELKGELKDQEKKRNAERRQFELLKEKYRILSEKANALGIKQSDFMIDQNSPNNSNKTIQIPNDPVIQSTIRKPFFTPSSSTIGGFTLKKRDDKPKPGLF